jgi:hypothetical protein
MTSVNENLFLKIFKDNWIPFKQKYPGFATPYYDEIIEKIQNCGDPTFGYSIFQCLHCGLDKKLIAFSCKSPFCLRCSRLVAADFVEEVQAKLHDGVIYRHLILTIASQLRKLFFENRMNPELFNLFFLAAKKCIEDLIRTVRRNKNIKCGFLIVIHIVGRMSDYKPHLHILVMDGGIDEKTGQWVTLGKFPYEILHKKWQYHLLKMVKEFDPGQQALVDKLWKQYPKGFVAEISEGSVPHKLKKLTKYLSKYLFRPAISLKRILEYDPVEKEVTYEYNSHKTKKKEIETTDVLTFIGRMVQQILPKGFQRVRYYGLQATASYERSKNIIQTAMNKIDKSKDYETDPNAFKAESAKSRSFGDKIEILSGHNPLKCSNCGKKMGLVKVWTKAKGVVFDYFKGLKNTVGIGPPLQENSEAQINGSKIILSIKMERELFIGELAF